MGSSAHSLFTAACFLLLAPAAIAAEVKPGPWAAPPVELQGQETPAQVQAAYAKVLAALSEGLAKEDQTSVQQLEALVHYAARPGAEPERQGCCQALAAVLAGDAPVAAKVWVLRQLVNAGKAEVLEIERKLLLGRDPWLREEARRALAKNPLPEAAEVLRRALVEAKDAGFQAALALALGERRDAASVPAIAKLLDARYEESIRAALVALGTIGDAAAAAALAEAQKRLPQKLQSTAAEARLQCAEQLLAAGQTDAAAAIYRALSQPQSPPLIRRAALVGRLKGAGDEVVELLQQCLAGTDADARSVALGHIAEVHAAALKALAEGIDRFPAEVRLAVLSALADRREKTALPAALACAKSDDPALRLAGIEALGPLGDASVVPLLLAAIESGASGGRKPSGATPDATQQARADVAAAARTALIRLTDPQVNEELLAVLKREQDAARRAFLVELAESRGAAALAGLVIADLQSEDAALRRQAIRVLGKLGQPDQIPAILPALAKVSAGGERDELEKALMFICERISPPESRADPILAACRKASENEQVLLLPVAGRIGGGKALEAIQAARNGSSAELREAAIRALCNWPDAAVTDDLLQLAQSLEDPAQRVLALRALVRVVTLKGGLPDKKKVALLAQAMELADRDQDRSLILDRAGSVRHIDMLRLVITHLDNPKLASKAGRAIVELAHNGGLKSREKAEYEAALRKVIEVCAKDRGLVDSAQRELDAQR